VTELRWNQEVYQEAVAAAVTPATRWLDAGCGWHAFPAWPNYPAWELEAEREVVTRAELVVGCDLDPQVAKHRTFRHLVQTDLICLPFAAESFTLVTLNMVVEHLDTPSTVFAEITRVLAPGGRILIHTPNILNYFALSHLIPRDLKVRILKHVGDDRPAADVFPTKYRANTPSRLRYLMNKAGLIEEWCRMLTSVPSIPAKWRMLYQAESLMLRALATDCGRPFRASILAQFRKSDSVGE